MLSATELSSMRATVARTFVLSASKLIKSNTGDGRGGRAVVWTVSTTFLCRLSTNPPKFDQQVALGGIISDSEYTMVYPYDFTLAAKDRVRINSVDYEITSVFEDSSYDLHGRCNLKRVV